MWLHTNSEDALSTYICIYVPADLDQLSLQRMRHTHVKQTWNIWRKGHIWRAVGEDARCTNESIETSSYVDYVQNWLASHVSTRVAVTYVRSVQCQQ